MRYTAPTFNLDSFNCPICGAFAHMRWSILRNNTDSTMYYESTCSCCQEPGLWRVTKYENNPFSGRSDESGELIYPDNGIAALPATDMPNDVLTDYNEAARIFSRSPRGAAALLRLALQKLCKHLGEDGANINSDIRSLASKNAIPPSVIKVADTVRITGNNAVHPGEMSDEDFDRIASKMFDLLNFIVKKAITDPKEIEALYQLTPVGPRKDAEAKDAKAKATQ